MKPRVTPLYYKCTSLYNGKIRNPHAYPSLCVESLVCVFIFLIHHVCALTWCLTWYQSWRSLALLQFEWAICVYGLCISAKILIIFAALRDCCSSYFAAFKRRATFFLKRSTIQNLWQHSKIDFEQEQQWCWRNTSEVFLNSNVFLQSLHFKLCIWSAAGYYLNWISEEISWFIGNLLLHFSTWNLYCCLHFWNLLPVFQCLKICFCFKGLLLCCF